MKYEHLSKIYHTDFGNYKAVYQSRFNSPMTQHFDFQIREYNRQNEYPAFFCYTDEFALLVEKIYKKHEQLLSVVEVVPPLVLEQFILFSVVEEVRATSDIEGVHSTRREIVEVVDGTTPSPRFSNIVAKYKTLLNHAEMSFRTCADVRAFYDEFAHREIAAERPEHKLDGDLFRKGSVSITTATGKTIHQGVGSEEKIITLLNLALNILNDENIPFFVRTAVFHYFFEYIHPFYDGNGRTARFISSYFLSRHFHMLVALRLSLSIKRQKKKYYDLFRETDSEWNCGDLTPFVIGFTEIILSAMDEIIPPLEAKIKQLVKCKEKLKELVGSDKLTRDIYTILLESSVFFMGGVSMDKLMTLTGKSRNTVKSRLDAIPQEHLIIFENKKYFYKLDMQIFKEHGKEDGSI